LIRAVVAAAFLIISVSCIVFAFYMGADTRWGMLFINLGTEIFGILVTVAVVEWFFERRRLQDRGRELSWRLFHALGRVVWIWQGGPQQPGSEELLGIISGIHSKDPVPRFTRSLLVNLGTQCREAIDTEAAAVSSLVGLEDALGDMQSLGSLRDGESGVSVRMVAEILEAGASGLSRVLSQSTHRLPSGLIRYRDPSVEAQQQRYYDHRHDEAMPGPADSDTRSGSTQTESSSA
jgi:hypothetical protein